MKKKYSLKQWAVSAWVGISLLGGIALIEKGEWWLLSVIMLNLLLAGLASREAFEE